MNFPKLFVLIFWRPLKRFKGPPSRVKKDHAEFKYNVAPMETLNPKHKITLKLDNGLDILKEYC